MADFRKTNTKNRAKVFYGLAILFLVFLPFLIPYKALGSQILIFMKICHGHDICFYAGKQPLAMLPFSAWGLTLRGF